MKKAIAAVTALSIFSGPAVSPNDFPDYDGFYGSGSNNSIIFSQESKVILSETVRAFNENCANADLSANKDKQTCANTASTLIQSFTTQYAAQYDRGNAVSKANLPFAIYAASNLNRICGQGINAAQTAEEHTNAALQCVRSIFALENDKEVKAINKHTGFMADFGHGETRTEFDKKLFNTIAVGVICAYGKIQNAKQEQNVCHANASKYNLKFK